LKVLGIYGSPRRNGNSSILLTEALRGAAVLGATIKTISVAEVDISGCTECGGCDKTGKCIIEDDMQAIYPRLRDANVILLASSIFFYGFPSQLKALIDRSQAEWNRRRISKNPEELKRYDSGKGYLLAVGATRGKNLFEGVKLTAHYFFDALDLSYEGGLFRAKIEEKGDIRNYPEILIEAYEFGKKIVDEPSK
jgi:multimeric flavodoxin WrbA